MFSTLEVPEILNFPDKLLPLITEFNNYSFFLIDGGRVSAKSQSVGRLLLTVAEKNHVRICCGREIQANIEESVYTLLKDLIVEKDLNWDVKAKSFDHRESASEIIFKGFREQGKLNIKGLEKIKILWIDEAQAITKETLKIIIPTIIRNKNFKIFFTMNRTLEDDPVYTEFHNRKDCLHIHINYNDNKHCPKKAIEEAENMKTRDLDSYNHVWLGQPLLNASNFVFPHSLIEHCKQRFDALGMNRINNNIGVVVDPSGMGADDNGFLVGNDGLPIEIYKKTIMSPTEKALKAVELCKKHSGWWIVVDCDGIGADTFLELQGFSDEYLSGIQLIKFNGCAPSKVSLTVSLKKNKPIYENMRAEAAFVAQKRAYAGFAGIDPRDGQMIEELKLDVAFVNNRGLLQLVDKKDIREQLKRSPTGSDLWKMFQWACEQHYPDQTFRSEYQQQNQHHPYAKMDGDVQLAHGQLQTTAIIN
jgi:hypothetical protein